MNWIDKAVGILSPEAGLRRARARAAMHAIEQLGYDGAKAGRRLDGWVRPGTSANAEVGSALKQLRDAARDLTRNYPLGRKALWEYKTKIIGTGIRPQWRTGDQGVDDTLDAAFEQWTKYANAAGRPGYYGMQSLALGCMAESGEVLLRRRVRRPGDVPEIYLPNRRNKRTARIPLQIQMLEPDFLDHAKNETTASGYVIQGVEFDMIEQRRAYWLFGAHPGDVVNTGWYRKRNSYVSSPVPASEIEHGYIVERIGQVRGVSWFASVITAMHDLDGYQDAERVRKRVEACLAAFVSQPEGENITLTPPTKDASDKQIESFEPGMVTYLRPGSQVTVAAPHSTGGYAEYIRIEQHMIAAGLLLLFAVLTGDNSQNTYSSYRGGLLSLKALVEMLQWEYAIPSLCDAPARWFLDACKLADIVPSDTPYAVEWGPPAFDLLDREAEANADKAEIRNGTMTLYQAISRKGYDPKKQIEEIAAVNRALDDNGIVLDTDPRKVNQGGANQQKQNGGDNGTPGATAQ